MRGRKGGRFVLTGSQHFGLVEKISQSLAGRAAVLCFCPSAPMSSSAGMAFIPTQPCALGRRLFLRFTIVPFARTWYANYLATYIQRDVRQITQVQNLAVFTRFVRLCAAAQGN